MRAIKIVGWVLVSLLFLLTSGAAAVLLVAHTNWGGDKVLHLILPKLNANLAGRIEAGHLRLALNEITLEDARLRDPEGQTVAQVERVSLRFAPWELVHKHLELREVSLQQPRLSFEQSEEGESNLQRALAGRTSPAKTQQNKPRRESGWRVDVRRLEIAEGLLDLRLPGQGATSHWRARHLAVTIKGNIEDTPEGRFALRAQVRSETSAPMNAALRVSLALQGNLARAGLSADGEGEVHWGESLLRFQARASQTGSTNAVVNIEELRLQPELVRVFAPSAPLMAVVHGRGDLGWDGETKRMTVDLNAALGGAKLVVKTVVSVEPLAVHKLALRIRSLDLAQVVQGGPPSNLELSLYARAQGTDLASLQGEANLHMPPGVLGGHPIGPVHLRAEADRGDFRLVDLSAALPGIRITGSGDANQQTLRFQGLIAISDLGKTAAAAMAGTPGPKARASGRGRISITAQGPVREPALHAGGRLSDLTWQELDVPDLRFQLDVPNASKPVASDLSLFAKQIGYGTRVFHDVKATYRASGPRFAARVSMRPFDISILDVGGTWNRNHTAVTLHKGRLRLRHVRWDLSGPTVISHGKNTWRVSGLDLRGPGEQRVRLEAAGKGRSLHADLWLTQLQLALLPAAILPAPLKPAGQVDAEIHVRGRMNDPVMDARLALAHAEIDGLADISLISNAHVLAHRISGDLHVDGGGANLSGHFDMPVAWPPPATAPLSLDLSALDVQLPLIADKLARAQVKLPSLNGLACLKVRLQGTGAHPDLALDLRFRDLQVAGTPMGNVVVQAAAHDGKPMTAQLEIRPLGQQTGSGRVSLEAGLALNELIRQKVSRAKWQAMPLSLSVHLEHIALAPVMALAGNPRKWSGQAALDASWQGTPLGGQGKLRLTGQGLTVDRYPPTDVVLDVEAGERRQHAHARVSRRDATLLVLDLGLQAPLSDLQRADEWSRLPVRMHAVLGPLDVRRDGLASDTYRDPSRTLQARVQAMAEVTGTLGAPRLQAKARVDQIRMDDKALGTVDLAVSYANRKAQGNLDMLSADGGRWHTDATILADLGYPAISNGVGQAPLEAHMQTSAFDVTGFSGLTPRLRTLGGRVTADLNVSGTVADPRPSGRLEWKDGTLVIIGMGEYRKIHLLVQGDREFLSLDELKLESGSGNARITGRGQHREQGGYDINAQIHASKLPLYAEGQPLATLSLDAKALSQVTAQQTLAQVTVSSARVVLSDAKKKQLQKLAQPEDVVLVENGTPLNAEQKRKLAKLDRKLGLERESAVRTTAPKGPRLEVAVTAPRDLWITGQDANIELSLLPGFHIESNDETRIFGKVEIRRGQVSLLGQRFDLKEGSSLVFGGSPDKPDLDITSTYNDWQDNILVEITAKGPPDRLQIGIRAPDRPDLTESQLYTLVVTGHLTVGGNTSSASNRGDQAASLLGGVVAGQVQKILAKKLPLDVLTIQTGSDFGTARVEAGTYVTRSLYVGYVSRLGPTDPALLQNRNAVRLEYDLTSRWSFQGEYGDAMNGNADVVWTKHY